MILSAVSHQRLAKGRCARTIIESRGPLNFLFVWKRIRSLPRVPESWARRSRGAHRAGKLAFRKQKPSRGRPKLKGLRSLVDRRPRQDAAADASLRAGFGGQASGLPRQQNKAKAIQARRGSPNKRTQIPACATATAPTTAPRRACGTTPLRARRRPGRLTTNRDDRDDGGAPHP